MGENILNRKRCKIKECLGDMLYYVSIDRLWAVAKHPPIKKSALRKAD